MTMNGINGLHWPYFSSYRHTDINHLHITYILISNALSILTLDCNLTEFVRIKSELKLIENHAWLTGRGWRLYTKMWQLLVTYVQKVFLSESLNFFSYECLLYRGGWFVTVQDWFICFCLLYLKRLINE